jgi:hypothetical protein
MMMSKSWTLDVKELPDGDKYIELNDEILKESGFKEGDVINWIDQGDGSWRLEKKLEDTELVLVECVSMFRQRYVVEVPKGKTEWALDTVTCEEAKEFSQHHMGETISSHRVISKQEVLDLCDVDNHYCKSWTEDQKLNNFVTWRKDYE